MNKFKLLPAEKQSEWVQKLNDSEDKSTAMVEVISEIMEMTHADLIKEMVDANEQFKADERTASKLGLRTAFNEKEKDFYAKLTAKQSITFTQSDVIPESIIDETLADVKTASDTLKLVQMAPADVKKWLVASKTGKAAWKGLTDSMTSELTAAISSLNLELGTLYVTMVIPKAIRDLALPFVDKYFTAIFAEAMHDGLVDGYLNGTGVNQPIGITKLVASVNEDGTHKDKTASSITGFAPANLKTVKKTLSNGGLRVVNKLYIIANPADVADYIDPALYYFNGNGYVATCKTPIEVIEEPMMAVGKAAITLDQLYVMGFGGIQTTEYKETKALDDANVLIAKAYGNGRAVDDNVAVVIDPTKLVEYVPKYQQVTVA